jgi:NADH:ubiquinone oxidoreductase subunit F (NADH-binding)
MTPQEVCDSVMASGLRGRGGAGFPTGQKWQVAHDQPAAQKYLICNADEGDPGAFMDRAVLEGDPFRVIEGMLIAAYAIGASKGYVYCRAEYPLAIARLNDAICQCRKAGLLGHNILGSMTDFDITIKQGAGAFVCGEETAILASIEGGRGMPRPRPPFPAVSGLHGKPTVLNNVETLANVPGILRNGAEWFKDLGIGDAAGTKVFALSGRVQNTGLVEVPVGIPLREVIYTIGGGAPEGHRIKAVQLGGPSGGCIPDAYLDVPADYAKLQELGAMMGSGGMVVMDERTCMVDVAKYFMEFIRNESCGKCTPCREGTTRMHEILIALTERPVGDEMRRLERFRGLLHLEELAETIKDTSLCGLGQSAANPVLSTLRFFRDEYEAHLMEDRCPAGVCQGLRTYEIDNATCIGCMACKKNCPSGAIIGERKNAHYIIVDHCLGCGACVETCPKQCIALVA